MMLVPLLNINQTVIRLLLNHLQPINSGYNGIQHPAVGKNVIVWSHKNPWWGDVGAVKNHNFIFNTFQVALPMAIATFYTQELWLE